MLAFSCRLLLSLPVLELVCVMTSEVLLGFKAETEVFGGVVTPSKEVFVVASVAQPVEQLTVGVEKR